MKTLAEQVKEFMEWRSAQTGKSFGPTEMASAVALHQKDVDPEKRCKRQNIESLIRKDQRTTLYLVALARAMGTSAEVLQLGKYSPPATTKDEHADSPQGLEDGKLETMKVAAEDGPNQPHAEDAIRVNLLANSGSMGYGSETLPEDVLVGQISLSPEWVRGRIRPSSVQALRFIHAYGDSMCPTFSDGDVLLVDTGIQDPSRADGVYVLSTAARLYIKRVTSRFDGGFDVSSDNSAVKTVSSLDGSHDVNVLGRVVWVWNGRRL
jgi:phage repressor protein C with HTH and peptisase S24 domain